MLFTRQQLEDREREFLASYAVKSGDSRGRKHPEDEDKFRLVFQKDKERVIFSKPFRRLDEKTQVMMANFGDHYRTRLTHTLEVAQAARAMARNLGLNEDLCEVIALAHDLGHPPFGHAGEYALDEVLHEFGMHFEHNDQSRRIVEFLADGHPNFGGMNLTFETLDGLIKHQTAYDQQGREFEVSAHLEAQVVNIADELAYINHDMDDGIRSGVITLEQISKLDLWKLGEEKARKKYGERLQGGQLRSRVISAIISLMIDDLCENTEKNLQKNKIKTVEDVNEYQGVLAAFSLDLRQKVNEMRKFLYDNFYMSDKVHKMNELGMEKIKALFRFYYENPKKFPKFKSKETLVIDVKDYIAGMTDGFVLNEYENLLGGK